MGPRTRELYERGVRLLMSWHALDIELHDFRRWFAPTGPEQLRKSSERDALKADATRRWEGHLSAIAAAGVAARHGA